MGTLEGADNKAGGKVVTSFHCQKILYKISTVLSKETSPKIKQFISNCWLY